MKIRLDRNRGERLEWEEILQVSADSLDSDLVVDIGPVAARGHLEFAAPGFLLRGWLSYEQTLQCTRCLTPLVERAESDFEILVVSPQIEERETPGEEVELQESELDVLHVDDEVVDTRPLIEEQLQLQLPMKPLCREDCRGLCPRCGADRNRVATCCDETGADPRWSGLQALRTNLQREGR